MTILWPPFVGWMFFCSLLFRILSRTRVTRDGDIYHNGHLGVALENGDFFIYEVVEEDKVLDNITVNQLYPSPETEDKDNNNFGKIVDTLYKFGNASGVFTYTFQ